MGNLIVMSFDTERGANATLTKVAELQDQELIKLEDAAVAVRHENGKVKVKQANSLVGAGALGGAFWGMLLGLLFFAPFLGMAVGAATGAIFGHAADFGINDDFIKKVSKSLQPGGSALFMLVSKAQAARVIEQLKPLGGEIIHTSLAPAEEKQLKEAFAVGV